MGQSSMILLIAAVIAGGVLLYGAQRMTTDANDELAGYHFNVISRENAMTGLNASVRKLVNDTTSWDNGADYGFDTTAYLSGRFHVLVTPWWSGAAEPLRKDTVEVRATGLEGNEDHLIIARYGRAYNNTSVPPAFDYAFVANDDLTLNGAVDINSLDTTANANIHTNGDLTSNGNNVSVEGYASYTPPGTGTVNPEKSVDEIFDPNNDENGAEQNVVEGDSISLPPVDASLYLPIATKVDNGDVSLNTDIDFQALAASMGLNAGTAANPFVWVIDGNLDLGGTMNITGYGMFVTTGDITIGGSITGDISPDNETTLGYFSEGNITISGGSTITGQLVANGTVTLSGNVSLTGAIIASDIDITVNGTVDITFAGVAEEIVTPGFTKVVPEGVRLIAFSEW